MDAHCTALGWVSGDWPVKCVLYMHIIGQRELKLNAQHLVGNQEIGRGQMRRNGIVLCMGIAHWENVKVCHRCIGAF